VQRKQGRTLFKLNKNSFLLAQQLELATGTKAEEQEWLRAGDGNETIKTHEGNTQTRSLHIGSGKTPKR